MDGSAQTVLFEQFGRYPKALGMTALLMLLLAAIPVIPAPPFVILAVIMGAISYFTWQQQKAVKQVEAAQITAEGGGAVPAEEPISKALSIDTK